MGISNKYVPDAMFQPLVRQSANKMRCRSPGLRVRGYRSDKRQRQ